MEQTTNTALEWTPILVAAVSIVPATIAAVYARRTNKHTDTGNGTSLAQEVKGNASHLQLIDSRLNMIDFEIKGVALRQDLLGKMFESHMNGEVGHETGSAIEGDEPEVRRRNGA